jgi:predicted PurR-regulated permease PerM
MTKAQLLEAMKRLLLRIIQGILIALMVIVVAPLLALCLLAGLPVFLFYWIQDRLERNLRLGLALQNRDYVRDDHDNGYDAE